GIIDYDEPGVFVAFEESVGDLIANVTSLGFDLATAEAGGQLIIDHIDVVRGEMAETGDWDLDGLFLRLGAAIDEIGAQRVVIDTIETLFTAFNDTAILRAELRRLFGWLKERGVTTIITGERGDGTLTRHGIEEYVSDCVIVLDQRVHNLIATRRLRVLKYRGSVHGNNEYPFLINQFGVVVQPPVELVAELGMHVTAAVSTRSVSSGVAALDALFGCGGLIPGSAVLMSGSVGSAKSILAASFCAAMCARGERALYFGYQETEAELIRNMATVGLDLQQWIDAGLLSFECIHPRLLGLEAHQFLLKQTVRDFEPSLVVVDAISGLVGIGTEEDVSTTLTQKVQFLKNLQITTLLVSDSHGNRRSPIEGQVVVLADVWIDIVADQFVGEHTHVLTVRNARGMAHSRKPMRIVVSDAGIDLVDVGPDPQTSAGADRPVTSAVAPADPAFERSVL
ncbi:MAG TPA: circadian clock protein KaiC, partial [Jatrophihabitantaceae bacterium]|nr:circadian clock protein KaiC [Jatrophihabitantaceae bacterium]